MKSLKLLLVLGGITLLSGCNALDRKCDFLPKSSCECEQSYTTGMTCANCSVRNCMSGTCSQCFACGNNFNDP